MSIFNLLKKIKLPGFEDDFVENPAEKAVAEAPKFRGRVIYDPREEALRQLLDEQEFAENRGWKEMARVDDPGDALYLPVPGEEER